MAIIDFEACYAVLGLPFGAGIKEINERWRKLSRVHHPDRHMRDPKAYRQALEKQKQLNNARDLLKKWFDANPHSSPPKAPSGSTQSDTRSGSAASNAGHNRQSGHQSQSTRQKSAQSTGQSHRSQRQQSEQYHYWDHTKHSRSNTASSQNSTTAGAATGWFNTTELKLTPLQEWIRKIDAYCNRPNSDSATALAMALGFAAVFGPLWIITAGLRLIFPDIPGSYPEWAMPFLLGGSGYVTVYLFRWYFAEVRIIKLQEQTLYFRTDRTVKNSIEYLKMTIEKQTRPNAQWNFLSSGAAQEAILEFEEEVLPEQKRPRRIVLRFEVKESTIGRLVGIEVRTTSPINSFSCKKIAESVLVELKKEFHEISA